MPRYVSSGSLEHKSERYRFVVMDRYGTDLWKLFVENNRQFPEHTVYKVAWQVVRTHFVMAFFKKHGLSM